MDEWHNSRPQDLITVSLCIQNAINKMHRCSLSITYMPAHTITPPPPWATQSTTLTSANCLPTRRHTRCLPSALYSEIRDSFRERNTLSESIYPLNSVTTKNCSQVETPIRTTSMQMNLPETVSETLCRNYLVMQTDCFSNCLGGWSQTMLDVLSKFSEMPLETAYGIQFTGNSSGGHSCSQHAKCMLPQNLRHLWHCAV